MATRIIKKPSIKIEVKDGKYKPFVFDNGKKRYLCDSDEPEPIEPTNRILYTVVEGGYKPESSWITENCSDNIFDSDTGNGYLVLNEEVTELVTYGEKIIPNIFNDDGDDSNIVTVVIPSQITSIGNNAFCFLYGLTSVTIPNSITSIGDSAFIDCSGLTSITCFATTPPTLGTNAFDAINTTTCIVPEASIRAYEGSSWYNNPFTTFVAADV